MKNIFLSFFFSALFLRAFSRTTEEWKSRTIYEIMTDRFFKGDEDTTPCNNLGDYCGGTFKGIEKNLDYIKGAGFNAIWISPVQPCSPGSYHGYWTTDFYGINPNFGTEQDFKDLVIACHQKDIWVMVDVAVNHIGYVQEIGKKEQVENNDYSKIVPFNDVSYYHKFEIECHDAERDFPDDQTLLESCWLFHLPDLDQENPFVRKALLEWVQWFVKTYEIDGLRLDALRHVSKQFWAEFSKASGVFTLGEAWDLRVAYSANYQNYIDSVLNFPLHNTLADVFVKSEPMTSISKYYQEANANYRDLAVLANFIDCHDKPRFLSQNNDLWSFKASLAFTICSIGIPTVYYGSEQAFNGGEDPANREPLWTSMNPDSEMYQYFKTLNEFRIKTKFYENAQVERFADESFYAFTRGEYFFAFTNSINTETREITNHPYEDNTWLCNAFNTEDCVQAKNGKFTVSIANKDTKILFPISKEEAEKVEYKILNNIKSLIDTVITHQVSR